MSDTTAAPRTAPDRRLVAILAGLVAGFWILGTVANALAPTLLVDHPLVLVALEPRNRYLLLTAGRVDLVPYVVLATVRRIASDPVYFALGALYGDRAIRWMEHQAGPRGARLVRIAERGYRRFSRLAVFFFPGLIVCVMAGATGLRTRTFLVWNLAGTVAAVLVLRAFSRQLEEPVLEVTDFVERYQVPLTVASIAAAVAYVVWQRRRGGSELESLRALTDDPRAGARATVGRVAAVAETNDLPWWKTGVVYQVYPRSFADGNGDGVGDLPGVLAHVDHLVDLGVDAVWFSPFYESPMRDNGYDISDHCAVDPVFGTLDDFDAVVAALHGHGIRVVVDFVPNHVSSDHRWFVEARTGPDAEHRDWFIWADPKPDGSPPTNWTASFTEESTWELDEASGQYYLHLFLPEQPDLAWDNPAVEAAQHEVLRFWLDRGVDGFRVDVINAIGKDPEPRDVPDHLVGLPHVVLTHHDTAMPFVRRIRELVDPPGVDRVVVGEVVTGDIEQQASYCGSGDGISCAVNFASVWAPWDRDAWRLLVAGMEDAYGDPDGGWPSYVLSNHDNPRHRTRYDGSEAKARAAAVLLLSLRGTPFLYQGDELGLEDAAIPPEAVVDPGGRDGCRAPIPWTRAADHGWGPSPWLPFPPDAAARSVEAQRDDPSSVLSLYRHLLAVRKASPALQHGRLVLLDGPPELLSYQRIAGGDERIVHVSFSDDAVALDALGLGAGWTVDASSDGAGHGERLTTPLGPCQAVILRP